MNLQITMGGVWPGSGDGAPSLRRQGVWVKSPGHRRQERVWGHRWAIFKFFNKNNAFLCIFRPK